MPFYFMKGKDRWYQLKQIIIDYADLDRSYIASVENGSRNISIVNIEKIAISLNVNLKDFFDYGEFDKPARSS